MTNWLCTEKIGDIGGFGVVYKCKDSISNREEYNALKKLDKDDEDSKARFCREVRIASKLNHPRIVKVIESNLHNAPYFYVMPLYSCSLSALLPQLKGDYARIRCIVNNILDGVEYLHNEGVYHRDLKPQNILYNSDNDLAITDFGLGVEPSSASQQRLTRTKMGMGTEFYTAPEQWDDAKNVDARADIYSLGVIIYMLFIQEDFASHLVYSKLPAGIDFVVKKCTYNNRDHRFNDVSSMRKQFNAALDLLTNQSKETNYPDVINELKAGKIDDSFIDLFSGHLQGALNRLDDVHDIFMSINHMQFKTLCERHFDLTLEALRKFQDAITGQGWNFSYTDTIGRQCKQLYLSSDINELRAILLYIIIEVGSNHNRWFVMDIARTLLKAINNHSEAMEVAMYLEPLKYELKQLDIERHEVFGQLQQLVSSGANEETLA